MTGTLTSIPLVQQLDVNGHPLSGCRLFLYQANTSNPVAAYINYGLSPGQEHPWPIVADIYGRIPMFWLADGFYRARLEDRFGRVLFDETQMPAVGGGTGGGTVIAADAFKTGDVLWQPVNDIKPGWVRLNGGTIGNAVSTGTERHHADCVALYSWVYERFDDTLCPVTGGRTDAATDFNGGKAMRTPDMRATLAMGLDIMGNTTAGSSGLFAGVPGAYINTHPLPAATGDAVYDRAGSILGANMHLLTIGQTVKHGHASQINEVGHWHDYYHATFVSGTYSSTGTGPVFSADEFVGTSEDMVGATVSIGNAVKLGVTPAQQANDEPHNNTPRAMLGTWFIRL